MIIKFKLFKESKSIYNDEICSDTCDKKMIEEYINTSLYYKNTKHKDYRKCFLNKIKKCSLDEINKIIDFFTTKKNINFFLWSVFKKDFVLTRLLIEKGVNINTTDKNGDTALFWAFDDSTIKFIQYLTDKGADWFHTNKKGYDFIDYMKHADERFDNVVFYKNKMKKILELYPDKYKKHLRRKDLNKFNI